MILMRILPGVLKELLKHVPTVLFNAVDWSMLAHELPKLSHRIMGKEGYHELFEAQKTYLAPLPIDLVLKISQEIDLAHNTEAAKKILTLFFAQIYSPHGIFLDLRHNHFQIVNDHLQWQPTGLWTKFSPQFSDGLSDIYDGFYTEQEELFHQGLFKIGLISNDWPESDRKKLAELFKGQFGSSVTDEVQFSLDTFKDALLKIGDFLLEKKVNISIDFLYLGIALVTLYSSLEKTEEKLNVREIYFNTKKLLNS